MYQSHRSREHNKNGLQPCTKTIDPENTIKMDYSHVSNHRLREHNKKVHGLQPCTKTIDHKNTITMDYSHVPKPSFKRTQ
jgi:hypothetical protein